MVVRIGFIEKVWCELALEGNEEISHVDLLEEKRPKQKEEPVGANAPTVGIWQGGQHE